MAAPKGRYDDLPTFEMVDARGRVVVAVPPAPPPDEGLAGVHRRKDGVRLDHLAGAFLRDGHGFWRICERNGAMHEEALSEVASIEIPGRRS